MNRLRWLMWVVLVGFLWTHFYSSTAAKSKRNSELKNCLKKKHISVVADNFYGILKPSPWNQHKTGKIHTIFLQKNQSKQKRLWKKWPQIEVMDGNLKLYISKKFAKIQDLSITGYAWNCTRGDSDCKNETVKTSICENAGYNETTCSATSWKDKYIINMMQKKCVNCDSPVKEPDEIITLESLNITLPEEGEVNASQAVALVKNLNSIISQMNGTSASLSIGEGIEGILVKETDPEDVEEVSFAYQSKADSIKIIEERERLGGYSRAVTVSKQAFESALEANNTEPYAAVFRFLNMTKDELNSTLLGDEVVAIEMGAAIKNLTDTINIHFKKFEYKGTPQCRSWDGAGDKPNWTDEGCETIKNGCNVTCRCSHLTFFAVLLTPLNETIPSSDLHKLTIITQAGCGLSMFFLGIIFFMHFLLRKTKAGKATQILIQLALSMFMLNFSFLINTFVTDLKNSVGCTIMAASMHYFMLTTFSWFAAQALHLWLQLYKGGKIIIKHYIIKISVLTWVLPSIVAIVLIILGKYGEQMVYADNPDENVAMCWINDNNVHHVVNIGYYVLVFIATFSTAIFIMSWLVCLKRAKMISKQGSQNGKNIVIILGLCCVLGITWGFAFLAYGAARLPGLYIFTIFNSFQGLFLFIYYYNTNHSDGTNASESHKQSLQSTSTLNTTLDILENPYRDSSAKKK